MGQTLPACAERELGIEDDDDDIEARDIEFEGEGEDSDGEQDQYEPVMDEDDKDQRLFQMRSCVMITYSNRLV